MNCNGSSALAKEIELLKQENSQLRKELDSLKKVKQKKNPASFKEKYAVKILDSLPDMLTVFDHNEVGIEVVSNEETNHLRVSNKAFEGMRMCEMISKEAYQNVHTNMQHVITSGLGSTAHHELEVNGEHHYYENRIFPLDRKHVLIMCRNISEEVATQKKMEIYKSILDRVSEIILAVAADGTLVYANKQFITEYGVKGRPETQKIYDLPVSLNTKELWESRLQEIRNHGGSFAYRAAYFRQGEIKQRVHQVSTFLTAEDNKEVIWFFTQDITDVIRKQDELRELNLLLEGILNNIPVYLFVKDPENDFRYLYWNKAFADSSKIPATKVIGHTDYEIFPEYTDAEKFRKDDLELLRTHERIDLHETYTTATDEIRIVQTLKTLVPMEERGPLLIGISWDITNFQNIEQELIKARIKAEQSDRLKSTFLANMSHEIRTPLNAIVGFSKLLAAANNPQDKKLYSDIINQNSEILLQLINDILDISKIEAETLEYVKQPMNLGELCRTIYQVHKDKLQEGVTLVLDNTDDNLIIQADQNRIMQVITNLITNAVKFTRHGEIRFGYVANANNIDFYVSDTGIGIADDKLSHIFDRFVKLNTFSQGSGLGLAICRMIIEKIGGKIDVTSQLGKGTTFRFTIPYKSNENPGRTELFSEKLSADSISLKPQQVKSILIAEDVNSNYLLLKSMLGKSYTLFRAQDGDQAVSLFKKHQPDLILMDLKMPNKDGLEATRLIRTYSKQVPIIALTAYAFESDREKAMEAGCNDFLSKPVSEVDLIKLLEKYA